jgi:hypothetical protein
MDTGHDSVWLSSGEQLVLMISSFPIFVILPAMSSLTATVHDSDDVQVASTTSPFAVYCSQSTGRLAFTATARVTLTFFAVRPLWACATYFLSSSPRETWRSGANLTLGQSQDIWLFHVSESVTAVSIEYDTEQDFDFLTYKFSGAAPINCTGLGSAAGASDFYTEFLWHSDATNVSRLVDVQLVSAESSLPDWRAAGSGVSRQPVVLGLPGSAKGASSAAAGIAVGCVVAVALIVAAVVVIRRRSKQGLWTPADELLTLDRQSDAGAAVPES